MSEEKKVVINRLTSSKMQGVLLQKYWNEVCHAHDDGKLLAFTTYFPFFEMLRAMDIRYVQDENYGAYLLAKRMSEEPIRRFEEEYDIELCSYMKAADGAVFYRDIEMPENSVIPIPDFLVCMPLCGMQTKQIEEFERRYHIPAFYFDIPGAFTESRQELEEQIPYVRKQLYEYAEFLSDMAHKPFDWEALKVAVANTKKNSMLWAQSIQKARHIPTPISWFDSIMNIFCTNVMQGSEEPQPYLTALNQELDERIAKKIGTIPNEKYRIMWDFNVMFSKVSWLAKLFASHDAAMVIGPWIQSPHRYRWELLNPEEPISSLAYDILTIYPAHTRKWMAEFVRNLVSEYAIDGIVLMSPRTCRFLSCGMMLEEQLLRESVDIPVLHFEGDIGDEKLWSNAAIETRVDAFMEEVAHSKEKRSKT